MTVVLKVKLAAPTSPDDPPVRATAEAFDKKAASSGKTSIEGTEEFTLVVPEGGHVVVSEQEPVMIHDAAQSTARRETEDERTERMEKAKKAEEDAKKAAEPKAKGGAAAGPFPEGGAPPNPSKEPSGTQAKK